jgi:hypothetical protein
MIKMNYGDTHIKVMAHKVDEMLRKGWKLVQAEEPVLEAEEPQVEVVENEDSEEE